MKVLLSHPTGNANVRAAANGLNTAGILGGFKTSIATFPGNIWDRLSRFGPLSELKRREFAGALRGITETNPKWELGRLLGTKARMPNLIKHEEGVFSIDKVYQYFDTWVASELKVAKGKGISGVYAYEDGAIQTFTKAKELGMACLYDLPIGYWKSARSLLASELDRWPDWAATLMGFNDSDEKLQRKDDELKLADHIFVASSFTAKTLKDFSSHLNQIHIIPYGFPAVNKDRTYKKPKVLKLLFVGGLSQRKGIADLFSAVAHFKGHVELTVVGSKARTSCAALDDALLKHNWIPSLPHQDVLNLMQQHDVLVFPSLFEGFGLVITEAMSQGMPVITTDRTVGPDLIDHNINGWLIEAGSTEALQAEIEKILLKPEMIEGAGRMAMQTAAKRPWSVYGEELANTVAQLQTTNIS